MDTNKLGLAIAAAFSQAVSESSAPQDRPASPTQASPVAYLQPKPQQPKRGTNGVNTQIPIGNTGMTIEVSDGGAVLLKGIGRKNTYLLETHLVELLANADLVGRWHKSVSHMLSKPPQA